ncbi:hypothetical protein [Methanomicrobium sp. W14]|uniref:hypothetical protein n=1 Tax=Methanomicrobium sp. W14 TaxID=2817839 RepID=UPI001AE7099F|nr:hypothetical protein [Methanomicrobium sp. W14]
MIKDSKRRLSGKRTGSKPGGRVRFLSKYYVRPEHETKLFTDQAGIKRYENLRNGFSSPIS